MNMTHWERIERTIAGEQTDRPAIALWRHFPEDDLSIEKLARHTVDWQNKWEFDLVKFMPTGTYSAEAWGVATAYQGALNGARNVIEPAIAQLEDWQHIIPVDVTRGFFGRQNQALTQAAKDLRGRTPILQTVFSPLTTARKLSSDNLYAHMRQAPDAVHQALRVITDVTIDFALRALAAGAHGIFLATQQASARLLDVEEYKTFGMRYDLEVLAALKGKSRCNMLHAHGEDIMFDVLSAYPVEIMNWHDRTAGPSLNVATDVFSGAVAGGLNEHRTLLHGSKLDITEQIDDAVAQTNGRHLIIAPGCVLPVSVTDEAIGHAVNHVRNPVREALAA